MYVLLRAVQIAPRLRNTLHSKHVVESPIGRKSKVCNKIEIFTVQQVEGWGFQIGNLFFQ